MAKLIRSEIEVGFAEPLLRGEPVRAGQTGTLVLREADVRRTLGVKLHNVWTGVEVGDVCEAVSRLPGGRELSKPDHILGRRTIAFGLPWSGYGEVEISLRHAGEEVARHVVTIEPPSA